MKNSLFSQLVRFFVLAALAFPASYDQQPVVAQNDPPPPQAGEAVFAPLQMPVQNFTGCGGFTVSVVNSAYEARVFELVNAERTSRGIPPLKRLTLLDNAGRYHAKDMADDNYFQHDSYDRSGSNLVSACAWSARITSFYSGWSSLGENIAAGYATPEDVMNGWMNSTGHRENILRTSFWELGVGYYEGGGSYYRYWVQDFGRRSGIYPVIINNDAVSTQSREVSLYIYGEWTEMRLRNNSDAWTAWQPFSHSPAWQLPNLTGTHTVSVELRKTGENASSSDTIYLDYPLQPMLGNLPDVITMTYSIASQQLLPDRVQMTPQNTGNGSVLTWQVGTSDGWYQLLPQTGSTPENFSLSPTNFITDTATVYTGMFTVSVTSPSGVAGSPHQTTVRLFVVEDPLQYTYLPALLR
jgi:uncharacterized protein YkwD